MTTGSRLPAAATAVLRAEEGVREGGRLHRVPPAPGPGWGPGGGPRPMAGPGQCEVDPGRDVRPRGQECRAGELLVAADESITPGVLGLAAAAGHDALPVAPRPRVDLLLLGDELLERGLPRDGLIRDALGPMLPGWLRALGALPGRTVRVPDRRAALSEAVAACRSEVVVSTGGTARGAADHLHTVLAEEQAELVVDGVAVRPGHPMLLARLPHGRVLVGLPGNPLAAVAGLLTLAEPVLRTLGGRAPQGSAWVRLGVAVAAPPGVTRLVPVRGGVPLPHTGPAMLRGLALADGLAVVPPGGAAAGTAVEVLALP